MYYACVCTLTSRSKQRVLFCSVHTWIYNFLKYCKQRVVIGGEHSTWTHVFFQVYPKAQYSARYAFSLMLMICQIISILQSACLQMTVYYRNIKNDYQELQKDLNSLMKWEYDWQMHFNPVKNVL